MSSIIGLGLRGFLVLCGAVVLGLSVTLAKKQLLGSPPSETSFSAFSGAFGIIASALGIAAIFFDSIPVLVAAAVDVLAAIFYLAAGVVSAPHAERLNSTPFPESHTLIRDPFKQAMAVALKGVSCTDGSDKGDFLRYSNKLINGGCVDLKGPVCGVGSESDWKGALKSRCTQVQADFAFEFIACAFGLGALAFLFLSSKRSGRTSYV